MKAKELVRLARVQRPPAPYGVGSLARCHSVPDLQRLARRKLPGFVMAYLEGGGEDEYTLRRNRAAFNTAAIVPRVLRDVHDVATATTVLGSELALPLALAPVGGTGLIHRGGELASARATQRSGVALAVSTLASADLESVARAVTSPLWFALYVWGDRGEARELLARAQAAGYAALIVTTDVTVRSKRERELRTGLTLPSPSLRPSAILDAARHPRWTWRFATGAVPGFPNIAGAGTRAIDHLFDGTLSWDDIDWIRGEWRRPLAVKGILDVDDARRAVSAGVDAVIVSNHGGRQLDHVPATIDALPAIADAVGQDIEVLVDSGIRRGSDILVALERGARAVLIGRAYLYGLAAAGEHGAAHAIDILGDELRRALALAGHTSVRDVGSLPSTAVASA